MNSRFLLLKFSTFTVEFLDFAVELRGWTGESRGLLNGRLLLNTSISYKFKNYLDWRIPNLFFLPLQNKNFL